MPLDPSQVVHLRRWAVLLDSAFKVPGLPVRFGFDSILGLIPGVGDLTTPAFTVLLLATGVRMRVPVAVLSRMVLNAGIDALIGIVPVAGDLVDVGWKANLRNLDLLERHAMPGVPATSGDRWFVAAGVGLIAAVCCLPVLLVVLAWYIFTNVR